MAVISMRQMLEAGVHFGHQTRRWNPKVKRFILTERSGIHIIDLQQSLSYIDKAYEFVKETVAHGGTVLFVGTKKQAQEAIAEQATRVGMPYVNQRWLDFTGRPLDAELRESWVANVHRDDQPDLAKTLAAAFTAARPFTIEYRFRRRDGEYRWVLNHGVPRRADGGELLGYVGSTVDVTQLRAAQRAMLETDLLRSAIFGALHGHVAALDGLSRIEPFLELKTAWHPVGT